MIARVWHGSTEPSNADAYGAFLRQNVFPAVAARVAGFRGGYVLRRRDGSETEFVVITLFDSLDDVRGFAGDDLEAPVIEPEAARLLTRGDDRATHYDVSALEEREPPPAVS
jgi:antibiotic biosynthesis monooxygenase (ABM) superfamily enzyme